MDGHVYGGRSVIPKLYQHPTTTGEEEVSGLINGAGRTWALEFPKSMMLMMMTNSNGMISTLYTENRLERIKTRALTMLGCKSLYFFYTEAFYALTASLLVSAACSVCVSGGYWVSSSSSCSLHTHHT